VDGHDSSSGKKPTTLGSVDIEVRRRESYNLLEEGDGKGDVGIVISKVQVPQWEEASRRRRRGKKSRRKFEKKTKHGKAAAEEKKPRYRIGGAP